MGSTYDYLESMGAFTVPNYLRVRVDAPILNNRGNLGVMQRNADEHTSGAIELYKHYIPPCVTWMGIHANLTQVSSKVKD